MLLVLRVVLVLLLRGPGTATVAGESDSVSP
jgi:hypothetical protein